LTEILHRDGVNVRYLGRMYRRIKSSGLRALLLVEAVLHLVYCFFFCCFNFCSTKVARAAKNILRDRWRQAGAGERPIAGIIFSVFVQKTITLI